MMLLVVLVALILVVFVFMYNVLISLRNKVKEAWSDIDVQLKRRYNLIPNIVETVKGYAAHEEGVFTKVTEARANAINATNVHDQGVAENMLAGALKSLFAVVENYPDLKANENFMQLQNELVDTEDKIQAARRFFNGMVRDYNTKAQQVPFNIVAGVFKFKKEEFFEIEEDEAKKPVEVSFKKEEGGEVPATAPESAPAEPAPPAEKEEVPAEPVIPEVTPEAEEVKPEEVAEIKEEKPAEEKAPEIEEEKSAEDTEPAESAEPEAAAEEEKPTEEEATPAEPEPEATEEPEVKEEEAPAGPEAPTEEPKPEAEAPAEEEKPAEDTKPAESAEGEEKKEGE